MNAGWWICVCSCKLVSEQHLENWIVTVLRCFVSYILNVSILRNRLFLLYTVTALRSCSMRAGIALLMRWLCESSLVYKNIKSCPTNCAGHDFDIVIEVWICSGYIFHIGIYECLVFSKFYAKSSCLSDLLGGWVPTIRKVTYKSFNSKWITIV